MTEGDANPAPRSCLSQRAGRQDIPRPFLLRRPHTRAPPAAYIRWRVTLQYSRTGQVLREREGRERGENEVGV